MKLEQVVRLLKHAGRAVDIVGLAIREHLLWDVVRLKNANADLLPGFVARGPCDA
jgi:arginase